MKSIYFETLKLGYENPNGISYNDIVKKLDLKFSDKNSQFNFIIWFYSNFYNSKAEPWMASHRNADSVLHLLKPEFFEKFTSANTENSYIKGDSLSKYIDYLELENTRKSSTQARNFSIISIALAIIAVFIQFFSSNYPKPPYEVILSNKSNDNCQIYKNHKSADVDSCNTAIDSANLSVKK